MDKKLLWTKKIIIYCLGVFILAMGVSFSIKSNLGVSPVNSIPYVVSLITKIPLGMCVTGVFCLFILLQVVMLGKDFKIINVLQIVCSTLFGFFVQLTDSIVEIFITTPTNYISSLILLAFSIVFVAIGVILYLSPSIMNLPGEGVMKAIVLKTSCRLSTAKMSFDITVVAIAVVLSLIFLGEIQGVREGTAIAAFGVGLVMKPLEKNIKYAVIKFLYGVNHE